MEEDKKIQKPYQVTITETLEKVITVTADSREDAANCVRDMYRNEEIILYPDDFAGMTIDIAEVEVENKIKVIIARVGKTAKIAEIENSTDTFEEIIGGWTGVCYPFWDDHSIAALVHDDDNLETFPNRALTSSQDDVWAVIYGNMIFVAKDGENLTSLSDEQIQKCMKKFKYPHKIYKDENNSVRYKEIRNEQKVR